VDDFEDPADLDGDGEFDAIDLMIMNDGENQKPTSPRGSSGCCVVLLIMGGSVSAGWWMVGKYFV
jgi:hypothetical protein